MVGISHQCHKDKSRPVLCSLAELQTGWELRWELQLALVRMMFFLMGYLLTQERFRIKYRNDRINQSQRIRVNLYILDIISTLYYLTDFGIRNV